LSAIEAVGLSKTYSGFFGQRKQRALDGVDLLIKRGTAFGLVGPNGAGKTTFIKTMLGIVRPTAGQIRILGESPESPRARQRVGYLPERLELPAYLTPPAFLASVARLKRVPPQFANIKQLLLRVGLAADSHRKIGGFSKGMRQRLGLAAAFLGQPELLVLDEPTDGIDPLGRIEIRDLLAAELRRGCTVFLNSHLLAETERICDRVGVLSAGKIALEGPIEELCRSDNRWRLRFAEGTNSDVLRDNLFVFSQTKGHLFHGTALELNQAVDRLRLQGVVLTDLRPDERDLEEVLATAVGAKGITV
jgi:ABC-2 type transport system ATP-binding protein